MRDHQDVLHRACNEIFATGFAERSQVVTGFNQAPALEGR